MSTDLFAETMTATVADRFVRIARKRQPLRRLAWRNAVQDAMNNFRPATAAQPHVRLANDESGAASCEGSQGGQQLKER